MWIYMNDAFVSCVTDKHDASQLLVRARHEGDLESLFPDADIKNSGSDFDYRYRTSLPRWHVADIMANRLRYVDYPSFKSSINDKERRIAYEKCWAKMLDWQELVK